MWLVAASLNKKSQTDEETTRLCGCHIYNSPLGVTRVNVNDAVTQNLNHFHNCCLYQRSFSTTKPGVFNRWSVAHRGSAVELQGVLLKFKKATRVYQLFTTIKPFSFTYLQILLSVHDATSSDILHKKWWFRLIN